MTVEEAVGQWVEGCTAEEIKGQIVRTGNWQPLARALRHCKGGEVDQHKEKLNGDTVLCVTPKKPEGDPPAGKTHVALPPFLLVVK